MPAALNEPVNLLQRLCEELEYSELLDTANNTADPYQRMVGKDALWYSVMWLYSNSKILVHTLVFAQEILSIHILSTPGLHCCLCHLWILYGDIQKPLQALQPSARRDVWVYQGGPGLPLHQWAGWTFSDKCTIVNIWDVYPWGWLAILGPTPILTVLLMVSSWADLQLPVS